MPWDQAVLVSGPWVWTLSFWGTLSDVIGVTISEIPSTLFWTWGSKYRRKYLLRALKSTNSYLYRCCGPLGWVLGHMGGYQNYGPFLGPYYNTAPNIWGTKKGTIILTTIHNNPYIPLYIPIHGNGIKGPY